MHSVWPYLLSLNFAFVCQSTIPFAVRCGLRDFNVIISLSLSLFDSIVYQERLRIVLRTHIFVTKWNQPNEHLALFSYSHYAVTYLVYRSSCSLLLLLAVTKQCHGSPKLHCHTKSPSEWSVLVIGLRGASVECQIKTVSCSMNCLSAQQIIYS